jgi:trk system potassium uptake protein TrkH
VRFDPAERAREVVRRAFWSRLSGIQLFVLSFAGLIGAGTLGLLVLPGLYTGSRLGVIDAFFTATSAVCVTGLTVVDTATHFTRWGQAWLLLCIQAGGLGILTFATLIIHTLGRQGGLHMEAATSAGVAAKPGDARAMVQAVLALTLAIELAGAAGLWLTWRGPLGAAPAVWHAVFHSISAFCNAGFSSFSDSLVGWRESPPVLLTIQGLILLGGIGFVVLEDLRERFWRRRARRLATHTRLVLVTTATLILVGWVLYYSFEAGGTLRPLGMVDRLLNALFMSVTPRTAGFNTVDYNQVSNPSLALTVGLMLIGGSPGSAAGGVKTTTAALLALLVVTRLRGARYVSAWGRTVPWDTVHNAASLVVGAITILAIAIFLLLMAEPAGGPGARSDFVRLVFEAHSAFGTVGLSMNKSPELSPAGRLVVSGLMFVGRVGPLGLTAAMMLRRSRGPNTRYALDEVAVG